MTIELFYLVMAAVALFLQYWIIRLAVRGGIEDADRRKHARIVEQQRWKDIQDRQK